MSQMTNKSHETRHIGSEGLRVLALIGVSAFHLRPDIFPGGFLAVVTFLVLAGFYTSRSFLKKGEIDLASYYGGKVRKLWPPLLFMLVILAIGSYLFLPEVFVYLRPSTLSAAGGWHNIAQILADNSYFNRHGNFDPLTHLWALSLEMQFYFFFPLVLWLLSQFKHVLPEGYKEYSYEVMGGVLAAFSLLSAYYMAVSYVPGADPTPVYYNSFARASAFLLGAAANLCVAGNQIRRSRQGLTPRKILNPTSRAIIAWILLILLVVPYFFVSFQDDFVFLGGMLVYSILGISYILVGGLHPVAGMGFMKSSVFSWLASRSYPLYLWQYALMIVFEASFRFSTLSFWIKLLAQLVLLGLISELSWRLFDEKPPYKKEHPVSKRVQLSRLAGAGVLGFLIVSCQFLPEPELDSATQLDGDMIMKAIESNQQKLKERGSEQDASATAVEASSSEGRPDEPDDKGLAPLKISDERKKAQEEASSRMEAIANEIPEGPQNPYGFTRAECDKLSNTNMVMIGDSVLAMALDGIYTYNENAYIDAAVSRHFFQGPEILQGVDYSGIPSDVIVIALSTNGDINEADMETYLEIANGRPLIFVNTVVPNTWEQPNNQKIANFVAKNKGVYLADWYAAAKSHPEYFYEDSTHPIPDGAAVYDKVVLKAVLAALAES